MTTTPPDDVAAMFDLPPPAAAPEPAIASLEAEEAALAAELAAAIESGGFATDAPDSRTDRRTEVSWPARMQLPNGNVIDVKVRNISENGVGLVSDERIPADAVVTIEMAVPPSGEGGETRSVNGTIRTTYTIVQGAGILCGGTWQGPPAGLERVIDRLEGRRP